MTLLDGEIYVLRGKGERDQIEVYDVIKYRLQCCLTVPDTLIFTDMTSCEHHRCVYVGDYKNQCVHRVDVVGAVTRWTANDVPVGLSVNAVHNVLVACGDDIPMIKEFSSHGQLIREITLPDDVIHPLHAIQTRTGQFIVSHGSSVCNDPVHRVCMISADGRHIDHAQGQRGSDTGQYHTPRHLTVDDNGCVFVVDIYNGRVTLLSPTLECVRQVVSRDRPRVQFWRLCLDTKRRLLYVVENDERQLATGVVEVFSV